MESLCKSAISVLCFMQHLVTFIEDNFLVRNSPLPLLSPSILQTNHVHKQFSFWTKLDQGVRGKKQKRYKKCKNFVLERINSNLTSYGEGGILLATGSWFQKSLTWACNSMNSNIRSISWTRCGHTFLRSFLEWRKARSHKSFKRGNVSWRFSWIRSHFGC